MCSFAARHRIVADKTPNSPGSVSLESFHGPWRSFHSKAFCRVQISLGLIGSLKRRNGGERHSLTWKVLTTPGRPSFCGRPIKMVGAHVDDELVPEYEQLKSAGSFGSIEGPGGQTIPIEDAHLTFLRTMAFEVLNSPDLVAFTKS